MVQHTSNEETETNGGPWQAAFGGQSNGRLFVAFVFFVAFVVKKLRSSSDPSFLL
jgi:hypothetical protein